MSQSKEQRAQKKALEEKKRKQTRGALIVTVAVIAVFVAALLTINSKTFRKNATAVTIGDTKFSIVDFNYFYYMEYYNYMSRVYAEYPGYADQLLPDATQPLDAQYVNGTSGETWADRISDGTLQTMTDVAAAWHAGHEAGYELSAEKAAEIDETYAAGEAQAELSSVSMDSFLSRNYGKGITGQIWKNLLYMTSYAKEYQDHIRSSFSYTQDEIESYYNEHADNLDVYKIRSIYFSENSFDNGMEGAKAAAEACAAGVRTEQDMIDAARDYNAETYAEDDSTLHYYAGNALASPYRDWVKDPSRQYGDVYVAENESHGAYYVVFYVERTGNDYPTASVLMISMYADDIKSDNYETTEAYEEALAVARDDLKGEAEEILQEWLSSAKDRDTFKVLYDDHTENFYYEDGVFESYHRYEYTQEMDDWVYDSSRSPGDAEIFEESDGDAYYFVVYQGQGGSYRVYLAESQLQNADYLAWDTSVKEGFTPQKTVWFSQIG